LLTESNVIVDENGNPNTTADFKRTTAVNTNYAANLTQITVTVRMRNFRTGAWGAQEQVSSLYTQ
jgi:hypothetical protein